MATRTEALQVCEFIRLDDSRWYDMLAEVQHDFYHRPEYLKFAARHEGGQAEGFYVETDGSRCLIPLLRKQLPGHFKTSTSLSDVASPYGFASPLVYPEGAQHVLRNALQALVHHGRDIGLLSAFLRFHPLLMQPESPEGEGMELINHGQTVYIDLSLPSEVIWRQTRKNHRVGIQKLLNNGFEVAINDYSLLDRFITIYHQTMRRVGAREFYLFSEAYFRDLIATHGEKINMVCVLSPSGEIAAGGLFSSYQEIIQFHLAGTSEQYIEDAPTKLMFDFVRRWGKENGYRTFHLGGGIGASADQLFHFKAGFSGLRGVFHTMRIVIEPETYAELGRQAQALVKPEADNQQDYFPVYRRPVD